MTKRNQNRNKRAQSDDKAQAAQTVEPESGAAQAESSAGADAQGAERDAGAAATLAAASTEAGAPVADRPGRDTLRRLLTRARRVERDGEDVKWTRNALTTGALLTIGTDDSGALTLTRVKVEDEERDDVPDDHAPVLSLSLSVGPDNIAQTVADVMAAAGVAVLTEAERAAAVKAESAKRTGAALNELLGVLNKIRSGVKSGASASAAAVAAALVGDGGESTPVVMIAQDAASAGATLDKAARKCIDAIRASGNDDAASAMVGVESAFASADESGAPGDDESGATDS